MQNWRDSSSVRFAVRLTILLGIPAILGSIPLVWARMTRTTDIFREMNCGITAAANGACMGVDVSFGANLLLVEVGVVIAGIVLGVIVVKSFSD